MKEILLKIRLTLLFLSNSVPFNGQDYEKQKPPGSSDKSLFRLLSMFRNIPLLVMNSLNKFDDIMQSSFWVISKITLLLIYASQFMISYIIPLSFFLLNLESVERNGKNYKNFNIEKTFQMNKKHFSVFEGLSFG